jgi:hypothetical protein
VTRAVNFVGNLLLGNFVTFVISKDHLNFGYIHIYVEFDIWNFVAGELCYLGIL